MPENHELATVNRKGLAPKLSGAATDFLGGTGLYSVPTGTGTSGVGFVPTVTAETNTTITMSVIKHSRTGNVVTMSGQFTADPLLTATSTSFEFDLPVASNLGAASDLSGVAVCGAIAGMLAEALGVAANNTAKMRWISSDITSQTWSWVAEYTVI